MNPRELIDWLIGWLKTWMELAAATPVCAPSWTHSQPSEEEGRASSAAAVLAITGHPQKQRLLVGSAALPHDLSLLHCRWKKKRFFLRPLTNSTLNQTETTCSICKGSSNSWDAILYMATRGRQIPEPFWKCSLSSMFCEDPEPYLWWGKMFLHLLTYINVNKDQLQLKKQRVKRPRLITRWDFSVTVSNNLTKRPKWKICDFEHP